MKTLRPASILTVIALLLVQVDAFAHSVQVTASAARVRAEPGANSEHIGTIANGVSVQVYGSSGNWLRVRVNGQEGYMHRSLANGQASGGQTTGGQTSGGQTTGGSTSTLEVKASAARVRATPGGEQIATLPRGTAVSVLGSQGDWYRVRVNGREAYMHASVLNGDATAVVQSSAANFRSAPGMGSQVTEVLRQGTSVEVISIEGEWAKVRANGRVGYVHQNLIKCKTTPTSTNVGQIRQIAEHINGQSAGSARNPASWMSPVGNRACIVSPTSRFGMRRHPITGRNKMHNGQDMRAYSGTPLLSPMDGVVTFAGRAGGYGNQVRIRIGEYEVSYSHMNVITRGLKSGSRVPAGYQVGTVGSTGMSTGPHLHMELWKNGRRIDPMNVFSSSQLCRGSK